MSNQVGISLYLQNGIEENKKIVRKAKKAELDYIFSSLNIQEEKPEEFAHQIKQWLEESKNSKLKFIFDINANTLKRLNMTSFDELYDLKVTHIRLDDGFSVDEIVSLSKRFALTLNASTLTKNLIEELIDKGMNCSNLIACHNYYPKPYTGLSLRKTSEINLFLHQYNIKTMGFVSGDKSLRGPLFLGLPTIEEDRNIDFLQRVLRLHDEAKCDIVMVGDIDISQASWQAFQRYKQDCIELECELDQDVDTLYNVIQHDRIDHSEYLIRSVESRVIKRFENKIMPKNTVTRDVGSICLSNHLYGRYEGEIEIIKVKLDSDMRVNVCGKIKEKSLNYLKYIQNGRAFILKKGEKHD